MSHSLNQPLKWFNVEERTETGWQFCMGAHGPTLQAVLDEMTALFVELAVDPADWRVKPNPIMQAVEDIVRK